jgi:hypothetical protein
MGMDGAKNRRRASSDGTHARTNWPPVQTTLLLRNNEKAQRANARARGRTQQQPMRARRTRTHTHARGHDVINAKNLLLLTTFQLI